MYSKIICTDVPSVPKSTPHHNAPTWHKRRAGPRVPPKGNTHRNASNEAQTVGTDVLGCPNLQGVT